MIKKYTRILLWYGVCALTNESFLDAADRVNKRTPQAQIRAPQAQARSAQKAQQPQTNPYKRYNDIADKYLSIESPTDENVQEFKELLEKDQFFAAKKQCKTELDLLFKDIEAKVEAIKINQQREEQIEGLKKNVTKIAAAQKQGIPTNIAPTALPLMQQLLQKGKRKPAEKPKPAPVEKPTPKPQPAPQPQPTLPELRAPLKPITPTPTKPAEKIRPTPGELKKEGFVSGLFEEELGIPTPEAVEPIKIEEIQPTEALAPFIALPKTVTTVAAPPQAEKAEQALVLATDMSIALDKILQPMQQRATTPELKTTVNTVVDNIESIVAQATPEEQIAILSATAFMVDKVAQQGPSAVQEYVLPVLDQTSKALVPTDMSTMMRKNGIGVAAGQLWSVANLPDLLYKAGRTANLSDTKTYSLFVENIGDIFEDFVHKAEIISPTVTSALVMASDAKTEQNLEATFASLLQSFDALIDSVTTRGGLAEKEEENTPDSLKNALASYKNPSLLQVGARFFGLSGNTPQKLVPQLIGLTRYLSVVGPKIIKTIESYVRLYGSVMNKDIMRSFDAGTLKIEQYENPEKAKNHTRDYRRELISKLLKLREIINQGISDISDKEIRNQFRGTLETLEDEFEKSQKPVKPAPKEEVRKPRVTKIPGLAPITTTGRIKKPKKKTETRIEPTEEAAVVVPRKKITAAPKVKKEAPKIAHPTVLEQSTLQQLEILQKQLEKVDLMATSLEAISTIGADIRNLEQPLGEIGKQAEFIKANSLFELKYKQFNRIQDIKEFITQLQNKVSISSSELGSQKEKLEQLRTDTDLQPFPEATYKQLLNAFNKAASGYIMGIIRTLEESLAGLHAKIAQDLTQVGDIPDDIYEKVSLLRTLQDLIPSNAQVSIINIFANFCAFYDALLYALYIPQSFNVALASVVESEQLEDKRIAYARMAAEIVSMLETMHFEETVVMLATISKEFEAFNNARFDLITTTNPAFQKDDGSYVYALPENTEVQIDENTKVPTLEAITQMHKKAYRDILEQWQHRVEKDDVIQKLLTLDPAQLQSQEYINEMREAFESLKGLLPEAFLKDLETRSIESEVFKNAESSISVTDKIAALKKEIEEAHAAFKEKNTIKLILFDIAYAPIKELINVHPQKDQLMIQLDEVTKLFANYLTDIAQVFNNKVIKLPADAYALAEGTNKKITDANAYVTNLTTFPTMLKKLNTLGLLANAYQDTSLFNNLYKALITGFGYVLATFDAINAKLVDNAEVKIGLLAAVWNTESQQYKTAQIAIELLKQADILRATYFDKLLQPYFAETTALKDYKNEIFDLSTLNLVNLTGAQGYLYARTAIKGHPEPVTLTFPTGRHMPLVADKTTKLTPYQLIIDQWAKFIEKSLKSAATADRQKRVEEQLKKIIETEIYGLPFKDINEGGKENNFIDYLSKIVRKEIDLEKAMNSAIISLETIIELMNNPTLLPDLAQLKKDGGPSDSIKTSVDLLCGNSFALLDGIIYWIYEQTRKDNTNDQMVSIIASYLKEPIQRLIHKAVEYVPYRSDTFKSLEIYAPKAISDRTAIPYRYLIGTKTGALKEYTPVNFKTEESGIELIQLGGTINKQRVDQQLKVLDILIQKLISPLNKLKIHARQTVEKIRQLGVEHTVERIGTLKTDIQNDFATIEGINKEIPVESYDAAKRTLNAIAAELIGAYKGELR